MKRLVVSSALTTYKKLQIALLGAALATLPTAAAAFAHQEHASCAQAGALAATLAKSGQLGTIVSGVATSGPGAVGATVASVHAALCQPAR